MKIGTTILTAVQLFQYNLREIKQVLNKTEVKIL